MKRILLPAGGAILATGLLAAGLASTSAANAAPTRASKSMASNADKAASIAEFWLKDNNKALRSAKQYTAPKTASTRLTLGGQADDDGKAGLEPPTGYKKVTPTKVKNINFPKTIGKVFFETNDGGIGYCSGTSIDAKYRNLVATAGHCVYDTATNGDLMNNWVFVPGFYQGKANFGVYVGKTAHTHYDFSNFEDYDRDYAFVTVYDGFSLGQEKEVTKKEYDSYKGDKEIRKREITKEEYEKCVLNLGECWTEGTDSDAEKVGPDYPGAVLTKVEVSKQTYDAAGVGRGNGNKLGEPETTPVTKSEYQAYNGPGTKHKDEAGNYYITRYFVQKWVKPGSVKKYYAGIYIIKPVANRGRLGDNVGGQGFAWNQKPGQPVFVFGYPAAPHPDGNKPYTGETPKWCYDAKPSDKTYQAPSFRVEEHIWIKCAMTPGASGGPWLLKYSNTKRIGYVNGVASLVADADKNGRFDTLTSPYFDGETKSIYSYAANQWSGGIVDKDGAIIAR